MIIASQWFSGQPAIFQTGVDFDTVRLARHHAREAVARLTAFGLEHRVGPILGFCDTWLFFLPPGSDDEPWPTIATYSGPGHAVAIPPPHTTSDETTGLHWIRTHHDAGRHPTTLHDLDPFDDEGSLDHLWFTDPMILRTTLHAITDQHTGNR